MKILHVVASIDPKFGGVSESIRSRGIRLRDRGHTVEVVTLDSPKDIHVRGFELPIYALGKGLTAWQYNGSLRKWLDTRVSEYDVVIVEGLWKYLGLAVRHAARKRGVPYYVFTHGMLDPWFNEGRKIKHFKKVLFWRWAEYRVLRDAEKVLFTTEEEVLRASKAFHPYLVRPAIASLGTIGPPETTEKLRSEFFNTYPDLKDRRILLFLGRIHEKKGVNELMDAILGSHITDDSMALIFAGPGDERTVRMLKNKAKCAPQNWDIRWIGMLTGQDKWRALAASDAFILPSHQENFGIAVVEALGCGRTVLISNKVNIWREVQAAKAGLIEDDSVRGVTELLRVWLAQTTAERQQMETAALAIFRQRYTVDAMADSLIRAIEED